VLCCAVLSHAVVCCAAYWQAVESHVEALRLWTYQQLSGLRHSNCTPLLKMFGAHEMGAEHQGGIFQFQV
jgi:hypothetical protein